MDEFDFKQMVLHSPFDISTHKRTFINYLEVVMSPEGVIEYAVPSHQEKLIEIACKKFNVTRGDIFDKNNFPWCPFEYFGDVILWLCNLTGYCSLWTNYRLLPMNVTEKQKEVIKLLEREGLLKDVTNMGMYSY